MSKNVIMMTSEESFHNNYGAVLQGHALYHYIVDLGFKVDIVRYREGEFTFQTRNRFVISCVKLAKILLRRKSTRKKKPISSELLERQKAREKLFLDFQHDTMTFYNERRMNYHQLLHNIPQGDVYVCGSDQIWNPFFKRGRNDPGYFLKFAPKGKKKVAYAPSFGCDDLPDKSKSNLKMLLSDFSHISVREKSGVEIIKRYTGLEAKLVVDPTMLLTPEYWKGISKMPETIVKPYILCYRFADSDHTKKMIDKISLILNIPVISLPLSRVAIKDDYQLLFDVGPREFIGLINNASLVCTDSFHATVFSLLMKTPVCVFLRESYIDGNSMNTRIISLLETLSLQKLLISEEDTESEMLRCLDVDFDIAHRRIEKMRLDSEAFLRNALKEA